MIKVVSTLQHFCLRRKAKTVCDSDTKFCLLQQLSQQPVGIDVLRVKGFQQHDPSCILQNLLSCHGNISVTGRNAQRNRGGMMKIHENNLS